MTHIALLTDAKRAAVRKAYSRENLRHGLKGPGAGADAARNGGDMREATHRGLDWMKSGGVEGDDGEGEAYSGEGLGVLPEGGSGARARVDSAAPDAGVLAAGGDPQTKIAAASAEVWRRSLPGKEASKHRALQVQ